MQVLFQERLENVICFLGDRQMYMHNSVQAIYVLSSCRVLSVIDRKDQIHLGFPLKSNCLGYVLGAGFIV